MLNFLTSVIYHNERVKDPNEIDLDGPEAPAASALDYGSGGDDVALDGSEASAPNAYVPGSGVDVAALRGLKKAAWSLVQFIPVLYLGSYDSKITGTPEYASRNADAATDIAGLGPDWVVIIRRNLDKFLESHRRRAGFHSKLLRKASLGNTPGFHSVPASGPTSSSSPTQAFLRDALGADHADVRRGANNRERVRRRAFDLAYSASDNMQLLMSEARAPRDMSSLNRLRELTGMQPVNPVNEDARTVVARGADEARESIFFNTKDVYASIRAAPTKAAGDVSGWENAHFRALCQTRCSPVLQLLTLLFESLARADPRMVPDQNNRVFCMSLLVPLPKRDSSDVRPIAIPNCFMKRTENILCRKVQSAAVAFLNPTVNEPASSSSPPSSADQKKSADQKITMGKFNKVTQYSFGIPSGSSKAVLRAKSAMELNPSWVSASIDMKNAFNSADLDFMFKVWAEEIAQASSRSSGSDLRCLLPYALPELPL
jgi:hypothetical protein